MAHLVDITKSKPEFRISHTAQSVKQLKAWGLFLANGSKYFGLYYLGIKYFIRAGYAEKRSIHKHPPDGTAGINPSETLFSRLQGFVSLTAGLSAYVCSCLIKKGKHFLLSFFCLSDIPNNI